MSGVETAPLSLRGLGLGCSHIASLSTRPSVSEIRRLLDEAYAQGVRFFDTADVYGQGDSERLLSRFSKTPDAIICTKAGLTLGRTQTAIRLVKPVLRPILHRFRSLGNKSAQLRQSAEQTDFDPARLRACLEGSLTRLKRDTIDVFLLHSPALADLENARLYDLLDEFKAQGLARMCGVSARSIEDATHIINTGRIDVIQVPMHAGISAEQMLTAAQSFGVKVIAREVFNGSVSKPEAAAKILTTLAGDPRISVILTGTTSRRHLRENIAAYDSARKPTKTAPCT